MYLKNAQKNISDSFRHNSNTTLYKYYVYVERDDQCFITHYL